MAFEHIIVADGLVILCIIFIRWYRSGHVFENVSLFVTLISVILFDHIFSSMISI